MDLLERILQALCTATGDAQLTLTGRTSIAGGDINQAARLDTSAGAFFVKWNTRPAPLMFAREALSLELLAESGTSLQIPRPICWEDDFLILTWLDSGRRVLDFDTRLGRGLAELHRATSEQGFGFSEDTYCGTTLQPNPWTEDWIAFYREHRLGYQIELAAQRRGVPSEAQRHFDRLLERLDTLLDNSAQPSLIHGDLWSGNLHVAPDGHPGILDPAAYYAHREAELGMMSLFGGFSERVYAAYDEAWPLAPGWRERLPLYELYHILNHYNLFGGGYGRQAFAIARKWAG